MSIVDDLINSPIALRFGALIDLEDMAMTSQIIEQHLNN